jgi:hypothetical protein
MRTLMRLLTPGYFLAIVLTVSPWKRGHVWLLVMFTIVGFVGLAMMKVFGWLLKASSGLVMSGQWEGHAGRFLTEVEPRLRIRRRSLPADPKGASIASPLHFRDR